MQNDWNGSPKVALIASARSESAWRVIAAAVGDEMAATFADQLCNLRCEVEAAFPDPCGSSDQGSTMAEGTAGGPIDPVDCGPGPTR